MKKHFVIWGVGACLFYFALTGSIYAESYVGLGYSGVTVGRSIPALHLAFFSDSLRGSFISTGVRTEVYSHNAYQASLYSTWQPGELLWGELEAGFGGALLHGIRAYREDEDSDYERERNTVWGPALYVGWEVLPRVVISLEAIYGIYDSSALALVFQENCVGTIGVRF